MRKVYCVNRALPTLPINVEDAARSEIEIEKALQVLIFIAFYLFGGNKKFWKFFEHFVIDMYLIIWWV